MNEALEASFLDFLNKVFPEWSTASPYQLKLIAAYRKGFEAGWEKGKLNENTTTD